MIYIVVISIILLIANLYYTYYLAKIVNSMVILKLKYPISIKRILKHPFFFKKIIISLIPYVNIGNLYDVFTSYHSNEDIDRIAKEISDSVMINKH